MAKKSNRIIIGLKCQNCGRFNYITQRNRINTTDKLKIKKYCRDCQKHTIHIEAKKLK
ncbi:MAG: 50S ribosomal protein L33 [bacterium]|nr:50S ribosomal protein L33 [bacterium]